MTGIDDFDLPSPAEAAAMWRTWAMIRPPDHRVALLVRDLTRARVVGFGDFPLPAQLGTGAWFAALIPTVTDDPLPLDGEPRRLACFAYQGRPGKLDQMVAWLADIDPEAYRPEGEPNPTWRRIAWPTGARAMLMLHRLAADQLGEEFIASPAAA